jgi:hypothetical protein
MIHEVKANFDRGWVDLDGSRVFLVRSTRRALNVMRFLIESGLEENGWPVTESPNYYAAFIDRFHLEGTYEGKMDFAAWVREQRAKQTDVRMTRM